MPERRFDGGREFGQFVEFTVDPEGEDDRIDVVVLGDLHVNVVGTRNVRHGCPNTRRVISKQDTTPS